MNTTLTTTTIEIVLILGFAVVVSLSKEQHVELKVKVKNFEGSYFFELNCTLSQTPAIPVAVFLLNNKSLENIHSSGELCFISHRKCQQQECECGLLYFICNITLQLRERENIFTCEVRFDEKLKGQTIHVAYQDSVLYNSSGIYSLNETKDVKGQPSPEKKPDTAKEQDDNVPLIIAVVFVVLFLISIVAVVTCLIYRNTRWLKRKIQKRSTILTKNNPNPTADTMELTETDNAVQNDQIRAEKRVHLDQDDLYSKNAELLLEDAEVTRFPAVSEEYLTTAYVPRPKKVKDKTAFAEERTQFIANTSTEINNLDIENRNMESVSNSNSKTSADVNLRDAKYETVDLAIKSAQLPSINLSDDDNRNMAEEDVHSNDDKFYNISLLDVENKKLDGKDLNDKNESDGEEPKFYPPEIDSYNYIL